MHNTLFDFLSASNGLQYIMALAFVAGFLVLWEVLMSPRPFKALAAALAEDLRYVRSLGIRGLGRRFKMTLEAAFIGAIYLAMLPVMFAQALGLSTMRGVVAGASYSWSPVRAYFTGRKGSVNRKASIKKKSSPDEKKESGD